ncbi:MAG: metallophosphoesterase [SAR324 cluster bacterium]|nr:metallophosphoesterase [SAR324 cluster bacterium]
MFKLIIWIGLGIALYIYAKKEMGKKACLNPRKIKPGSLDVSPQSSEIRILLFGDAGSGDANQKKVAESSAQTCAEKGCDLVLLLGDNFIMDGVSSVNDPQFQYKFEEIYPHDLPFYAVFGNHDLRGSWQAQIDYTDISKRWNMPNVNYTFEAGPVFIQAINTSCTFCSLWTLFKPSEKPWRLIFGHRPLVTSGRHRGMTAFERSVIKASKPDFVLSGHNHILEHIEQDRIDHIVSGGGGAPIHEIPEKTHPERHFFIQDFGYVWMHLTPSQANVHFYNDDGNEIYHFTRTK